MHNTEIPPPRHRKELIRMYNLKNSRICWLAASLIFLCAAIAFSIDQPHREDAVRFSLILAAVTFSRSAWLHIRHLRREEGWTVGTWLKKGSHRLLLAGVLALVCLLGINWLGSTVPRRGDPSRCTDQLQPGFTVWMEQDRYSMTADRHTFYIRNDTKPRGYVTNPIWLEVYHDGSWYEMQRIYPEETPAVMYLGFSTGTTQYTKNSRTYGAFLLPGRYRYVLEFHREAGDNTDMRYAFAEFEVV